MFVKVIRGKYSPGVTQVYEVKKFEFRRLSKEELRKDEAMVDGAKEELWMRFCDGEWESIVLFEYDEVWLSGETGQTIDRWRI